MNNPIMIPMTIASDQVAFDMSVSSDNLAFEIEVATAISYVRGRLEEKTAVPGETTQVILPGENYDALSKVTVQPIPPNYGRVAWNGSYIKVY